MVAKATVGDVMAWEPCVRHADEIEPVYIPHQESPKRSNYTSSSGDILRISCEFDSKPKVEEGSFQLYILFELSLTIRTMRRLLSIAKTFILMSEEFLTK